jgi:hypothetical protein
MDQRRRPLDDWSETTEEDPFCQEVLQQHRRRIARLAAPEIRTLRPFKPPRSITRR